jgi:DNA-binding CsgD family transcriptional regulator
MDDGNPMTFEPERVAQLRAAFGALDELERLPESLLRAGLERLRDALDARLALAYVPEPTPRGWQLALAEAAGPEAAARSLELRALPANAWFEGFDPFAVEAEQRNRVREQDADSQLGAALGLAGEPHVRALLCEGPRLLACVVVFGGALGVERLDHALGPLRRALARVLVPRHRLFEALLESLARPAFLLCQHGRVECANQRGLAWLDADAARSELEALRRAALSGTEHPGFALERLDSEPGEHHWLVRAHAAPSGEELVTKASRRWQLKPSEQRVLERLVLGDSNKEIAAVLGFSEVTVERRLTRVYKATGTRSRTQLLARLRDL